MLIADGKQDLLEGATLTLNFEGNMFCRAYYNGKRFLLDFVKVGKISYCLAKEADWEIFCRKVPQAWKEHPDWVKESKTENDAHLEQKRGS